MPTAKQIQPRGHPLHQVVAVVISDLTLHRSLFPRETTVPVRISVVTDIAVRVVDLGLGSALVDDLGRGDFQLGVGGRHVVALEKGFLSHLPICRHRNRLPPVVAHFADGQAFEQLAHRRDEVVEGFGVAIEVDEDEAGEADVLDFAQGDVAVAELAATEFLPFEDEFVAPAGVPAPAVKRADDLSAGKVSTPPTSATSRC